MKSKIIILRSKSFGRLVYLAVFLVATNFILTSCGHPLEQKTVNNGSPKAGSTTISDQTGTPNTNPAVAANNLESKSVHSTFQSSCDAKKEIKYVKNEDGSKTLLLHSFCIKDASAKFDQAEQKIRFKGLADFDGFRNLKAYSFDVSGSISKGRGILKSLVEKATEANGESKDPKCVAAAFCNDMGFQDVGANIEKQFSCNSFFIDLYVMVPGYESELFDEQVEGCGQTDKCLSLQAPSPMVKTPLAKKEGSPTVPAEKKPDSEADKSLPAKSPTEVFSAPPDLETNFDNAEQEGADLPNVPTPYIALNTSNRVNSLIELFQKKEVEATLNLFEDSSLAATTLPPVPAATKATTEPEISAGDTSTKPSKPEPTNANSAKPAAPRPKIPKVRPAPPRIRPEVKPGTTPLGEPEVGEIKTATPTPEDPSLLGKEFPWNISTPTRGPMQAFGGGWEGHLENATELTEPLPGEPLTFILDNDTKNYGRQTGRKCFGTFYAVDFLKKMSIFTYELLKRPIRINDLSLQGGGKLKFHDWHRAGLDADVEYTLIPKDQKNEMTAEQKWMIFQRVGASPIVEGILISKNDKRAVCEIANLRKDFDLNSRIAMQKMRTMGGHKTHFHINFSCTYNSRCQGLGSYLTKDYSKNEAECLASKPPASLVVPKEQTK